MLMDEGQTDMTKAIVAFHSFPNTPPKKLIKGHIYFTAQIATFLAEVGNILTCKFVTPLFHWLPLLGKDLGIGSIQIHNSNPSFSRKSTPNHYTIVGVGSIFSVHS